jgi:hypothetical protein
MLIKRNPKLSWFINLLAILLMCLLITNSILGSIYINNLKDRMANVTNNYFQAERTIQASMEALAQIRLDLFNYALILQNKENNLESKENILNDYRKSAINLSSLIMSLKKQNISPALEPPISELISYTTNHLLYIEKIISNSTSFNENQLFAVLGETNQNYTYIKEHLDNLSDLISQQAFIIKDSDNIISEFFPPILFASFIAALLIGGSLIYTSRRAVRSSILSLTQESLTEAYQYQQDCLITLEACQKLTENKLIMIRNSPFVEMNTNDGSLFRSQIEEISTFVKEIKSLLESRQIIHQKEMKNLKEIIQLIEIKQK